MKHQTSLLLAAAAAVALFAAPVFAQPAASAAGKPATTASAKTATVKHKRKMSCYDYAWQSSDMQNCLAKQSAKPAAATTPAPHKAKVTKAKATKSATAATPAK